MAQQKVDFLVVKQNNNVVSNNKNTEFALIVYFVI